MPDQEVRKTTGQSGRKSRPLPVRFTLRALLSLMLLIAVGLGIASFYYRTFVVHEQAMERVAELGGSFTTEPGPEWLGRLFFRELNVVVTVDLDDCDLSDQDLTIFGQIKTLRRLSLDDTQIDDTQLASFANCRDLEHLSLNVTRVTDRGLAVLTRARKLRHLELRSTDVTDAGLTHLAGMSELSFLHLGNTRVSGQGMEWLTQLAALNSVWVPGKHVHRVELERVSRARPSCAFHVY